VRSLRVARGHTQPRGEGRDEALGVGDDVSFWTRLVREATRVCPCGMTIGTPVAPERPPRQLFARVPLALSHVDETVRTVAPLQPQQQIGGPCGVCWPEAGDIPFIRVPIGRRHERRFSAHRQTYV